MRAATLMLVLTIGGSWAAAGGPATPTPKADSHQLSTLISRLGSHRFSERQAATRTLSDLGSAALATLQQAAHGPDAEVRRRADDLVRQIERRLESEKLLTPKRVHLVYKNKPVPEAVDDFAKMTGFSLQLLPAARQRLTGKRLTLDTGDTTFWQAYAQFCAKAGIVEVPAPTTNQPVNNMGYYNPYQQRPANPITLSDGKPQPTPVCYTGAMRVRVLPRGTPLLGHSSGEGETVFGLDVVPQGGMQWQGIVGMRVLKAVDENGLHLSQPGVYVGEAGQGYGQGAWVAWMDGSMQTAPVQDPRQVPVYLRLRSQPSRILKELTGVVAVQIQTEPMPLITVPDLMKAAGKDFTSSDRHKLKVLELDRRKTGTVRLRVQLEGPSRNNGFGGIMVSGGAGVQTGLALKDAKGHEFSQLRVESMSTNFAPWAITQEMTIVYAPGKSHGPPVQLVYTAPREAVIDVPFTFKDVPLP